MSRPVLYSNIYNTTNLWAQQKGLSKSTCPYGGYYDTSCSDDMSKTHAQGPGLKCHGWSEDDTAEKMEVGFCFSQTTHDAPPKGSRQLIWSFFGFSLSETDVVV